MTDASDAQVSDTVGPPAAPDPVAPGSGAPPPRRRRRAVRPGAGHPDPPVDLRSADDSDVGWRGGTPDSNDDRLRRDVPPHW